jgi:peroxidase
MERREVVFSATLFILVLFSIAASPSSANLSFNFYAASCPPAEFIVRNTVMSASSDDSTIPGKLLRLLFHDCFVEVSPFA